MKTRGFGSTDVGRKRKNNEDALLVDDRLGLYAVADGLGGHAAGERASRVAIDTIRAAIKATLREHGDEGQLGEDKILLRQAAKEAMAAACAAVHEAATANAELSGMGCTLTLLLVSGPRAVMAHAGDSRLYLCREGSTWQLSSDHTIAADLVRRGEISAREARAHPYSGALTRGLGIQSSVDTETLLVDLLPDDVFLLCSDGLSRYVEGPGQLGAMLAGVAGRADAKLERLPDELVAFANQEGGADNVTAVVVQVVASAEEQGKGLPQEIRAALRTLGKLPVLESLKFADLLRIFNLAETRVYEQGRAIDTGDPGLCVALDGELELVAPDGRTEAIPSGRPVGLTNLLVPLQPEGELRARTTAHVLCVGAKAFHELARRRPWMGVAALSGLAEQLGKESGGTRLDLGGRPSTGSRWSLGSLFRR